MGLEPAEIYSTGKNMKSIIYIFWKIMLVPGEGGIRGYRNFEFQCNSMLLSKKNASVVNDNVTSILNTLGSEFDPRNLKEKFISFCKCVLAETFISCGVAVSLKKSIWHYFFLFERL